MRAFLRNTPEALIGGIDRLPRYRLAHLPTPLEALPRFSEALGGPPVFIKRDDCTGLALGGNKTRHNEFLLGDALRKGADLFVWGAGVQSNNCRQTAAACAKAGLGCHLVLTRGKGTQGAVAVQGNLLLDHLVGASYEIVEAAMGDELDGLIAARAAEFRERGRVPYFWDRPVVMPLAAVSYAVCMAEIVEQSRALEIEPQAVYVASAGSTGAGLALGAAALGTGIPVRNICPIEWEWDTRSDMAVTANRAAELIGIPEQLAARDVDVTFDYIAPGYGKASPACLEAIALLARTEGILLDPVYSGKATAALIHHIRRGELDRSRAVVFVHTGGTPALFAYAEELAAGIERWSLR